MPQCIWMIGGGAEMLDVRELRQLSASYGGSTLGGQAGKYEPRAGGMLAHCRRRRAVVENATAPLEAGDHQEYQPLPERRQPQNRLAVEIDACHRNNRDRQLLGNDS